MTPFETLTDCVARLKPTAALVLGSGMGSVPANWTPEAAVPFGSIPGLVDTAVVGHSGELSLGFLAGRPLLLFRGRLHFYEGHPWDGVGRPVQLAAELGIHTLLLTNAAGGIRSDLGPGSLMAISDHLAWQRRDGWRAPGPMSCHLPGGSRPSPYCPELLQALTKAGADCGIDVSTGIYAAVTGPCYETPAEIRAFRLAGADAVGMSTAHEVETGNALGLRCAAISCITNAAAGITGESLNHKEVLEVAAKQTDRLSRLLEQVVHNQE